MFELVDLVKKITFDIVVGHYRTLGDMSRTKSQRKSKCALCLHLDVHALLSSDIVAPASQTFGLRTGLTPPVFLFFFSVCKQKMWDFSASIIM